MDSGMSNLIAFLLSDASMHLHKLPNGKIRSRISLRVTDENFAKYFQQIVKNVFSKEVKIKKRSAQKDNWSEIFEISFIVPKEKEEELRKISETFRTKPFANGNATNAAIPSEIFSASVDARKSFLRIFASAEGSVILAIDKQRKWWSINRWISISCKHSKIHYQLLELLKTLGIEARSKWPEIIIKGKENLENFRDKIGFLKGCKVTNKSNSKWRGFEKNSLLGLSIDLYEIDKTLIQKFKTKDDVFVWLKTCVRGDMPSET